MDFEILFDTLKSNWRTVVPIFLVIAYFYCLRMFSEYTWVILVCSFIFSFIVLITESKNISKIIKENIFIGLGISFLVAVIYFFSKVNAVNHFNTAYQISPEYLNYSVTAWAVIVSALLLIGISCFALFFCFAIQTKKQGFKLFELVAHLFSCLLVFSWIAPIFHTLNTYDKNLLHLDAYLHSDCQTLENLPTIRKDNKTCYSFVHKNILEWNLEEHLFQNNEMCPK